MKTDKIHELLKYQCDERAESVIKFHKEWLPEMLYAMGSSGNHQCWKGGYYDHISDCFHIAERMWLTLNRWETPFNLSNILYVLYFHDIEKLWKYGSNSMRCDEDDKWKFFLEELPAHYDFWFNDDELNALKYIHGEGDDYRKDKRVMGPLAGFCHAVDVLSARTWPERKPCTTKSSGTSVSDS